MKLILCLFCCIGASLVLKTVDAGYDMTYIQDECSLNKTITLGQNGWSLYGFVDATSRECYEHNKTCSVTLSAKPGHHVTMRFQWMSIACPSDYLNITGDTKSSIYCESIAPPFSIYSSSNWVHLSFVTDSKYCSAGFRLYYTSYHYGECSENEFRCSFEGRCIPNELKCDSYDNCGDWSDEMSGACGLSTAAVVSISVSCALVGIVLIACIFYCICNKKHSSASSVDGRRMRSSSSPARNATAPMGFTEPIGPPKYVDAPPPSYTCITSNGIYAGLYEDQDQIHPPPYQSTFTTTPYSSNSNSNSQSLTCNNGNTPRLNNNEDNSNADRSN